MYAPYQINDERITLCVIAKVIIIIEAYIQNYNSKFALTHSY